MSFPQVLAVAAGLVLIYYILGAIVSTITQILNETFETRGVALEMYLRKIAGDKTIDLTSLPQIQALRPIRYANWWNIFSAGIEEKKVEKIPCSTLVDAFFDLTGLSCKPSFTPDELMSVLKQLPDSEGKQAMLRWVEQGVTNVEDLRGRTTDYFNGLLTQASLTFKARARTIVIILSLLITVLLGTDSIQLAKDLWADAGLRALAEAQAAAAANQPPVQGDISQLTNLVSYLGNYSLRLGWWQAQTLPAGMTPLNWVGYVLLKFLGLAITAVAVSQGSSFWYDVLRRITGNKTPAVAADSGS